MDTAAAFVHDQVASSYYKMPGFAGGYDTYRPKPPAALLDLLCQYASVERPALVVDLGSGTGLSTRFWAGRAAKVIGVEPNAIMRQQAESYPETDLPITNIRYLDGYSGATTLPDECADIVTCAQSLHWMEPASTFAEIARILRPGGVFAAYDYEWPPTIHWEVEHAFQVAVTYIDTLFHERVLEGGIKRWPKQEHLARMQQSGRFRYARELCLHHQEAGDAERFIGLLFTWASIPRLLERGYREAEIGLSALREVAWRILGDRPLPWYWSYQVRLGVK
jgi:SAM-dependent methyltransferase